MKIGKLTQEIKEHFVRIDSYANDSAQIETNLTYAIETNKIYPTDLGDFDKSVEELKRTVMDQGEILSDFNARRSASFTAGVATICMNIFEDDDKASRYIEALEAQYELLTEKDLAKSYLTTVKIPNIKIGEYELKIEEGKPYQLYVGGSSVRMKRRNVNIPRLCATDFAYNFPVLTKAGQVISMLSPAHVLTTQESLEHINGNVLCLGVNLGYFAFLASELEFVNEITIVEKDTTILEIFNEYILPQFKARHKIKTLNAAPLEYLKNIKEGEYDTVYCDFLMNLDECDDYLRVKHETSSWKKPRAVIHNEGSFVSHLSGFVCRELEETYYNALGYDPSQIPLLPPELQRTAKYISRLFKDEVIESKKDMDRVLSTEYLLEKIENTHIKY